MSLPTLPEWLDALTDMHMEKLIVGDGNIGERYHWTLWLLYRDF